MIYDELYKLAVKFSKAADEVVFFVDLDETLIHSFRLDDTKNYSDKVIRLPMNNLGCIKRPYADEFLTELNQLGIVHLLTASKPVYANSVLEKCDLLKYFNKIYTRDDLDGEQKENNESFYLIDNLPSYHENTINKMDMLGEPSDIDKHLINVSEFVGNMNDDGLIQTMEEIKEILSSE